MVVIEQIYIYARVATEPQRHNNSLRRQVWYCKRLAQNLGCDHLIDDIIKEVSSAYSCRPPLLEKLVHEVPPNSFILVARYDRFSRNLAYGTEFLDILTEKNVGVLEVPHVTEAQKNTMHPFGRAYCRQEIEHAESDSRRRAIELYRINESRDLGGDEISDSDYEDNLSNDQNTEDEDSDHQNFHHLG